MFRRGCEYSSILLGELDHLIEEGNRGRRKEFFFEGEINSSRIN